MTHKQLKCTIGVIVHNEGKNISNLLDSFLGQKLYETVISKIVVVSSASSDETDKTVEQYCSKDSRIKLIKEPVRRGKSAAINLFLAECEDEIAIISSGDLAPAVDLVEKLTAPFKDSSVGMTGGRPIPINSPKSFIGYLVNLQWELHHKVALNSPKLGELVAFRKIMNSIPEKSAVDEASIEAIICEKGLKLLYVPEAIILNKGPENIRDFLKQRRRIAAGHLWLKKNSKYKVSTGNISVLRSLMFSEIFRHPASIHRLAGAVLLELWSRLLGWMDLVVFKKNPYKWDIAESTKNFKD